MLQHTFSNDVVLYHFFHGNGGSFMEEGWSGIEGGQLMRGAYVPCTYVPTRTYLRTYLQLP